MEEEKQDVVQESIEQSVQKEEPQAEPKNPIFDALYDVSQEVVEEEEPQEEITPPTSLMSALHELENEPEGTTSEEPVQDAVQEEPKEEKPKPKQKIKRKVVDPNPKLSAPVKRQPKQEPIQEEDPFVGQLVGKEKDNYELAKWASGNIEDHKGAHQKLLDFYKSQEKFIKEQKEMNPHLDLRDSVELQEFRKRNAPELDFTKIKDEKILKQAEERAVRRLSGEMEKQKHEIHRAKVLPKYEELAKGLRVKIIEAVPKEFVAPLKENFKGFAEANPVEAKIMNETMRSGVELGDEFYKITTGIIGYDENNPTHQALRTFIEREQSNFINTGKTQRGGKMFIRRERMQNVPQADKGKYYTFTDDDIIKLIIKRAGDAINKKLAGFHETMQKSGYVRQNQPQVPQQQQPAEPQRPPAVPPPSPRAGNVPVPQGQPKPQQNKVMELLGL